MLRRSVRSLGVLILLAAGATGCSSGHNAFAPSPTQVQTDHAVGVAFTIVIPRRSVSLVGRRPQFISQAVQSAAIAVNGGTPVVANLTPSASNCASTTSGLQCTIALNVAAGSATFDEKLYDQPGATGNLLATGRQTATIVAGQANKVSIALSGVIVNLAVTLANPPVQGTSGSIVVNVAAQDADKQTITGDPYAVPITVSTADTTGAAKLSLNGGTPAGSVIVTLPSDVVTLVYNGTPVSTQVTASASNVSTSNVTPAVVQPKTPSTTDWTRMGFDGARTGYNPSETAVSSSNVKNLTLKWKVTLGGPYANTQPIVAANVMLGDGTYADVVYVGDEHGNLYAINTASHAIIWSKQYGSENEGCGDMPDATFGNTSAPLFDRKTNRLYVIATAFPASNSSADNRFIYALDPGTGASSPGWPASGVQAYTNAHINNTYSGLNESADGHYVYWDRSSNCDFGPYYGAIGNVDTAQQTTHDFEAVPLANQPGTSGNGIWSWGNPTIDPDTGALFAGVGNAFPENAKNSNSVITLDPVSLTEMAVYQSTLLSGDADFGTHPVPYDQGANKCMALGQKNGVFYVFDRTNLGAGPTQTFGVGAAIVSPSYSPANNMIYLANGSVQAYSTSSLLGCKLTSVWSSSGVTTTESTVVSIANGVVYAGGYHQVYAVDATTGGAPLWTSPQLSGQVVAEPTIANGRLYVLAWDCPSGNCYDNTGAHASLYAFGLP